MTASAVTEPALLDEVTRFLYREARLQDEHDYDSWESLWTDDGLYWIPANGDGGDPEQEMSIVYDSRSRIALRVRQLNTGRRPSQTPRSRLRRIVSNVEIVRADRSEVEAASNALVFESRPEGDTLWAARNEFTLRREQGALRIARKKVILVNNGNALGTMAFLL